MSTQDDQQGGPVAGGGALGAAIAWIGWWVVGAALWLALVDNTHFQELLAGVVAAAIGASGAVLVRMQRRLVLRPRLRWLLRLWRPVVVYPRDIVLVSAELVRTLANGRRSRGRLLALPFTAREEDPRHAARLVLMKSAGSFAPNTYVVGTDDDRGLLLVHQLAPRDDAAADADPLGLR